MGTSVGDGWRESIRTPRRAPARRRAREAAQSSSAERLIAAPHMQVIQTRWAYNSIRSLKSKPFAPHPLFASFIEAAVAPFFNAHRDRIVALAARHRLPALYEFRDFVEAGGFMCYGPDNRDVYHRVATYVDRILKGAKPADMPGATDEV
jgi:hypothetical protein